MDFYQVPISELFPESTAKIIARSITLDLAKINASLMPQTEKLRNFTRVLSNRRKDWNGYILTIRDNDLAFLSLLLNLDEVATLDYLREAEFLAA
jgi:hypothetical protein